MSWPGQLGARLAPDELEAEDYLALAAILLLPWAFGGVEVWAYRSAAWLLACAAGVALVKHGPRGLGLGKGSSWLLPAALLGLWGLIQVVPLAPSVIETLSPRADELYRATFPGYPGPAPEDPLAAIHARALEAAPEFEGLPEPDRDALPFQAELGGRWSGWRTLSLHPKAGMERLLWYVALLLGFLVVRRRCEREEVSRLYRNALFGLFLALAAFGLIQAAASNEKIYWIRGAPALTRPFGPYVNRTDFAGVMEMAVPWLLGYLLLSVRVVRGVPPAVLRSPVVAATAILCGVAALATASKAAAVFLGVTTLAVILIAVRGVRGRLITIAVSAGAVALAVPLLSRTMLGDRVQRFLDVTAGGLDEVGRWVGWKAAGAMFRDYWLTGSGFGSFRDVFPYYMPTGESARWAQLHNDYYELLIEGGVIAGALLLWLTWNFWSRALRPRAWRHDGRANPEAVGLLLGLITLSVHACFDFNHQIPANALLFVTLAAIAVARGESSPAGGEASG